MTLISAKTRDVARLHHELGDKPLAANRPRVIASTFLAPKAGRM